MGMGGFSYGGIDVRSAGVSRGGVLGRTNNTNAQAAERGASAGGNTGAGAGAGGDVHPLSVITVLFGMAGILFALYLARRNSEYLQRTTFGLNWYTTIVTGLLAVVFIVIAKIGLNKLPPNALTTVFNAV